LGREFREELAPPTRQEVAEALSYSLRFGLDGLPRQTGHEHWGALAATELVEHLPRSRSACLTQRRSVSAVQPIFAAIDRIVAQRDGCCASWSSTIRTARSRTSGE